MTNLGHLESAERALNKRAMVNLAHVVQDAREEIEALRKDKARLDALEMEMKDYPIVLHDCAGPEDWPKQLQGLSLLGGKRTLRDALDVLVTAAHSERPGKLGQN